MAVIAAVNAAVGAYYYLRVIGVMFLRSPIRPATRSRAVPTFLAAVALAGATLFFGIYPEPIAKAARKAAPVPTAPAKADAR
jgi:NADH-quinone oxidoreductase subunit N